MNAQRQMTVDQMGEVVKAIGVTCEVLGQVATGDGLRIMAIDLACYPLDAVLRAVTRVRRECRRVTLADIIERLEIADGHPGADEAWAIAHVSYDQNETVVWTPQMAAAAGIAESLWVMGDKVAARMAFRDAYVRLVDEARRAAQPVKWNVALGWNLERREKPVYEARVAGKISHETFIAMLGEPNHKTAEVGDLLRLAAQDGVVVDEAAQDCQARQDALRRIRAIKQSLQKNREGQA